jgi:peptidoglycan/xylan/chitin deacetylase (PgdA/CDA1 family)
MIKSVPVLLYHHINRHEGDTVTVTADVFQEQIRILAQAGYRTLTLDELMDYIAGALQLSEKAVVLTFDDGWLDNFLFAFPVLASFRYKSVAFLITDRVNASNIDTVPEDVPSHRESKSLLDIGRAGEVVMDWPLIRWIRQNGLVDFYSHTVTHRKSTSLDSVQLEYELTKSKSIIEFELGSPCSYLCWPYGDYNEKTVFAARSAGYKAIFTTEDGFIEPGADPFRIRRIEVKNSVEWLKTRLCEGDS